MQFNYPTNTLLVLKTTRDASNGAAKAAYTLANSSRGDKPQMSTLVVLTFFLVGIFVCIYRKRRSTTRSRGIGNQQKAVVAVKGIRKKEKHVAQDQFQERRDKQKQAQRGIERNQPPKRHEVARQQENGGGSESKRNQDQDEGHANDDFARVYKRGTSEKGRYRKENVKGQKENVRIDNKPFEVSKEQESSVGLPSKYPYAMLMTMTKNFDPKNKIGGGSSGNVFRGTLMDGTVVAVKCLKYGGLIDDFKNEVKALSRLDHLNLVKLIGYCDESVTRILVYEYMRNESLDKWIFHEMPGKFLTWPEKKHVIHGIALGLVYLHENCEGKILHCDLKPRNVFLDENKNAKLYDFGLANLTNKYQSSSLTKSDTPGHMAPEVIKSKRITNKVDVYSFGVLVLEVVFGRQCHSLLTSDRHKNTKHVKLNELIKNLSEDMRRHDKEIEEFGDLAIRCLREKPEERPTMLVILAALRSLKQVYHRGVTTSARRK